MSTGIPERIGPYEIGEAVGQSAMGALFSSRDPETGQDLIIAIAHDTQAEAGHTMRMRREALTLLRLAHSNLLSILDVGALHGRLYVITARIEGQTIDLFLTRARRSWRQIVALYSDAGRGLAAAHARAVVHGAVSPGCIHVDENGRVVVTDFALLRDPQRAGAETPTSHELVTREKYLAPERIRGAPATIYSDQYEFAASLWESLTSGSIWRRMSVPFAIDSVLKRARSDVPNERYPSMHALLHDLQTTTLAPSPALMAAVAAGSAAAAGLAALAGC